MSIDFMYSKTPWADRLREINNEKEIVRILNRWDEEEPTPISILISTDWGYRLHVYPQLASVEGRSELPSKLELRKLLAWFVRHSGVKFTSSTREGGEFIYLNLNEEEAFLKRFGVKALIILGQMPIGDNCKLVTKKKTVEYLEVVCNEVK